MSMEQIELAAKKYRDAREQVADRVQALQDDLQRTSRSKLPGIKRALAQAVQAQSELQQLILDNPQLFEKPKTVVLHQIKLGYQKGKGKLEWEDDDQVVKLIRKHLADQAEILIKTKEAPIKAALANLSVAELKKIGVVVEETGDAVFIKPTDSEVDKTVNALLKGFEDETIPEAA